MKKFRPFTLWWLLPLLLVLLGVLFYGFGGAYRFTALVFVCIAALIACYLLLHLLGRNHLMKAKILRTILSSALLIGICVVMVTGSLILRAGVGEPSVDCAYLVVLGAKVNGTSPSLSLSERIKAAAEYLTAHPNTIAVVSGGQGPDEGISEAECMYHELTARGIDPQRIWMEDQATSTWENLQFSLNLIEEKTGTRPTEIGLISSEYHMFRATLFACDCGVTPIRIPATTTNIAIRINYTLREVAGVWHYLILGGTYDD
ncbi:MAG: YdcF family protein [Faecousia sp.]